MARIKPPIRYALCERLAWLALSAQLYDDDRRIMAIRDIAERKLTARELDYVTIIAPGIKAKIRDMRLELAGRGLLQRMFG